MEGRLFREDQRRTTPVGAKGPLHPFSRKAGRHRLASPRGRQACEDESPGPTSANSGDHKGALMRREISQDHGLRRELEQIMLKLPDPVNHNRNDLHKQFQPAAFSSLHRRLSRNCWQIRYLSATPMSLLHTVEAES